MRTIFIATFQGTEFRNIIRTDVYKNLVKEKDVRIVLFTDARVKKEHYEKEFHGKNVFYEVVGYRPSRFAPLLEFLKFNLVRTLTLDLKRRQNRDKNKAHLAYFFKYAFNRLFARPGCRKIARMALLRCGGGGVFAGYFERYKPDVVLLGHLFSAIETDFLIEAKRRSIPTVGLILSWDKLTARGMIFALPDVMLVHNMIMREEAIRYADMPENKIQVIGIPHFDRYFRKMKIWPREEFARMMGLDPKKRYLLYCPEGKTFIDSDETALRSIDDLIARGEAPRDLEIIVRLPPNDAIDIGGNFKTRVVIQRPGTNFSGSRSMNWDMTEDDFTLLENTLYHSSLMVAYASTMVIEAALFDKPIINMNIAFDGYPPTDWLYFDFNHYLPIAESKGTRFVKAREELGCRISEYLARPETDREGRKRIVEEQIHYTDGKSADRLTKIVLGYARKT